MAAGLPGTGIGGLFFILSAFFMVIVELGRTIRGRSSLARWAIVARQAAIAAAMVAAVTATIWILHGLLFPPATHGSAEGSKSTHPLVPFAPVLISLAALTVVLVTAKIAQLIFGRQTAHEPAARETRTSSTAPQTAVAKMLQTCMHPGCAALCLGNACADHESSSQTGPFVRGRPWPPAPTVDR
jgi:lysylphosphatidylglycerol synthetase-like protein (DUF2156 family)